MTPDSEAARNIPLPSSFRDDAGFVFEKEGTFYRQVNASFREDFEAFRQRLYAAAVAQGWMLCFEDRAAQNLQDTHCIIRPQQLPFISYPYEWPFDMLKEAALVTLELALLADAEGLELRDATPFNLQLADGRMKHIDHLSFGLKKAEGPWPAYRQFCETFLAPLALMHYTKAPLQTLSLGWMEGIPLEVARKWLPLQSRMNLHLLLHLHIHGRAAVDNGNVKVEVKALPKGSRKRIFESLRSAVKGLEYGQPSGRWSNYYQEAAEREGYIEAKEAILRDWLREAQPQRVFDAGANEGHFSLLAAAVSGSTVISGEPDHYSVNRLYGSIRSQGFTHIYPVLFDFAHPSPALGLNGRERPSIFERVQADLVLALAVVHHLFYTEGIPFSKMAEGFRALGPVLLVEWVPPGDPKVAEVVANRHSVREGYTEAAFLEGMAAAFNMEKEAVVGSSGRKLYLLRSK